MINHKVGINGLTTDFWIKPAEQVEFTTTLLAWTPQVTQGIFG